MPKARMTHVSINIVGYDPAPPEGAWCVLLPAIDDDLAWSRIVRARGEDWEQAISGATWSQHKGDCFIVLPRLL